MSYLQFTKSVQIKLHQFVIPFQKDFTKPEFKFIRQMVFGILKGGSVQLNTIGRCLEEKISLKKVTNRLGKHLEKSGLWDAVTKATLQTQRSALKKCRFVVFDLSDIRKEYAEKMAGLAWVHDGSKSEIGKGYWLCNATAVDEKGSTLLPCYSELYSHEAEVTSENQKILQAVDTVFSHCSKSAILTFDRGGDRNQLMLPFLANDREFIIRQTGERDLFYKGEKLALKTVCRKARLPWRVTLKRMHKNRLRKVDYTCGAVQVYLPADKQKTPLWIVVMKREGGGYCWLLCHFKDCQTAKQAVELAIKGYGFRWKIEEVHRQIKGDYQLESICLQRYEALKTMNALLWMAASFLYTRLDTLALQIISLPELGLVNRKKLKDLLKFIYYKLAAAVKKIMAVATMNLATKRKIISRQMPLSFET